ncbi:MAG TPA: NAD-dependent epimerase/dehydratase family protein [Polyangiaceae bacterium]|jgi:nucleoside-diphosphate-sugar epimerase
MRIAVTGGSGELGTHVLRRLAADDSAAELVCVDIRPPLVCSPKLRFFHADVRDRAALERAFAGCDAVLHFAFIVTRKLPRAIFWGINVEGSKNAFEAAAAAGVKRVVYTSSVAQYGVVPGHPIPIVEETPRRSQPELPYAATKQEVEGWLDAFEAEHRDMTIARIRPALLVGEGMEHGLGRLWKRRALLAPRGAPIPIVWDEDVADAVLLALKRGARGSFNTVADDQRPAAELARACGMRAIEPPRVMGVALARLSPWLEKLDLLEAFDEQWLAAGESTFVVSSEKARRELGWAPTCPTAIDVMRRFVEVVPARLDRRISAFLRAVALAARLTRRMPVPDEAVHLGSRLWWRLTGEGGGDVGILWDAGKLTVTRKPPRPPTAIATMAAKDLLGVLAGRTRLATHLASGQLRVEGDPAAAEALVWMIDELPGQVGVRGFPARALARWIAA